VGVNDAHFRSIPSPRLEGSELVDMFLPIETDVQTFSEMPLPFSSFEGMFIDLRTTMGSKIIDLSNREEKEDFDREEKEDFPERNNLNESKWTVRSFQEGWEETASL